MPSTAEQVNALKEALLSTLDQMLKLAAVVGRLEQRIATLEKQNKSLWETIHHDNPSN